MKSPPRERWKIVKGFPAYQVSSFGRVRSVARTIQQKDRLGKLYEKSLPSVTLRPGSCRGYLQVQLGTYGKSHKVHRLVASAFLENIHNKPQVNHKDGDKANNVVANLEWSTHTENQRHARQTGLHKFRGKPIVAICDSIGYVFASTKIAEDYGYNRSAIRNVLTGSKKTHAGMHWYYL